MDLPQNSTPRKGSPKRASPTATHNQVWDPDTKKLKTNRKKIHVFLEPFFSGWYVSLLPRKVAEATEHCLARSLSSDCPFAKHWMPFSCYKIYTESPHYTLWPCRTTVQYHNVKQGLKRALCGMRQESKDSRAAESLRVWPQIVLWSACRVKLVSEVPGKSLSLLWRVGGWPWKQVVLNTEMRKPKGRNPSCKP